MLTRIGLALAGALTFATMLAPAEAFARGGHGHGGGGHHGGFHHRGGHFGGGFNNGGGFRGHRFRAHGPFFGRPHFHGPRFVGRPYFWRGPRRVYAGGGYRPYPVYGPRPYGAAAGCSTRRSVSFLPSGWRKVVTVRTCYVP